MRILIKGEEVSEVVDPREHGYPLFLDCGDEGITLTWDHWRKIKKLIDNYFKFQGWKK